MKAYQTETIEQHGHTYRVGMFYDVDMGPPWVEHDGHGIVSEWELRDKHPGELILATAGKYHRFYDYAASVKKAYAECWDSAPYNTGSETKRQQSAKAARADFERLRAWWDGDWHWCGIEVTEIRTDSDGFTYDGSSASLWGIESDCEEHYPLLVQDLIGEIEAQRSRKAAA